MHREGVKCKSIRSLLENLAWYILYVYTSKFEGKLYKFALSECGISFRTN